MPALRWILPVLLCTPLGAQQKTVGWVQAARLNNIGVAFMNQQLPDRAVERFEAATHADAHATQPLLNKGIALLYQQKLPEAEAALKAARAADPDSPRPRYCLGLLHLATGDVAAARQDFQEAVARDANDADSHYFLGTTELKLGDYTAARPEFEATLQRNPLHASAEFGLARVLQRTGDAAGARQHLARFQELTDAKNGTTVSAQYTEQGRFALAQEMPLPTPAVEPMIPVHFVPAPGDPVNGPVANVAKNATGGGLCMLDPSAVGAEAAAGKVVLAVGDGALALQGFQLGDGRLRPVDLKRAGLAVAGHGVGCAVGDFDNDGRPDLAVAFTDRVAIYHNLGGGRFADVTAQLGIQPRNRPTGITFVDFDHDGDLDLYLTGAPEHGAGPGAVLWRNNGNMTFTEWTAPTALAGIGRSEAAAISDVNNDRAIDFVVTGATQAPALYLNRREGAFQQAALFTETGLPATRGVAVADFNKDGWMDVVLTHSGAPGVSLWQNQKGAGFHRVALPLSGTTTAGWGVTPIDFDNDGWIDLAVLVDTAAGPRLRLLRNRGPEGFQDVTEAVGLGSLRLDGARALVAVDLQARGAMDLVVGRVGAPPLVLRNMGGERHHAMRIQLAGLADNKSAIGTKVEIFANGLWQKFELPGSSGYASQGALEIEAGLGTEERADIVRLLWPSGVPQDELNVAVNEPLQVKETDRRGSSCPVLFAWDGSRYSFISDVIGAAVIGHWVSPTERNASDSDEWIKVDGSSLKARNGRLSLRFGEPMEEINYIDQLRLVAVDHPEGTEVFPNERFLSERPFADGHAVVASPALRSLAGAWDTGGADVLPALAAHDHNYVHDFTPLSYAGFTTPHSLTLDLGPWTPAHPLRLFLDGYIEYFSASSMYAAWQAGLKPEPPSVEAQLPDGSWQQVIEDMGFPAGLPRTIVVDLTGKLPPGTRRIRLKTNLQIYWDRIQVDNGPEAAGEAHLTELPLSSAQLAFRGYPRQVEGAMPGDLTYDYQTISATGPFAWQRGTYTHFGEVTPLLTRQDDRYVIFGSGEEIDAEFDPSVLRALPPHWRRDYFFYADGFVKDMDFYEALPFTVAELPFHRMSTYPYKAGQAPGLTPEQVNFQLDWNDRFESGSRLQEFDFHYTPATSSP